MKGDKNKLKDKDPKVQKVLDEIDQIAQEQNIPIFVRYEEKNKYYFLGEFIILIYSKEENMIDISFHVNLRPDLAGLFSLLFYDIEGVDVNILDLFMRDNNGNVITGEECMNRNAEIVRNSVIESYVQDQMEYNILKHLPTNEPN